MTTRAVKTIICAAALATLAPRAARGSAADAFEHKIPPVSGQSYTKAGKIEIEPSLQLSMDDAFFSKYLAGARVAYHFSEYVSVGVNGAFAFANSSTGSAAVCGNGVCKDASQAQLYQVPGYIKWMAGAEVAFSPVYGKLNIFGEKAVHLDLSLIAGFDLVSYRDVLGSATALAGGTPSDAMSPGGHIGVGTRIFLGRSCALDLQVKDVLYSVKGLQTGKLQTQLFAQAGLSFFFPIGHRDVK